MTKEECITTIEELRAKLERMKEENEQVLKVHSRESAHAAKRCLQAIERIQESHALLARIDKQLKRRT